MNIISVEVTYPSSFQSPLPTPPCTPPPILRPQSFGSSNQITNRKGLVGCYDIHELNEELRRFGISDEMRKALLRNRRPTAQTPTRRISTKASSSTGDAQDTNEHGSSRSRVPPNKQLLHSAAARSCYVDFSGNFRDTVRAQSVKMSTKNFTPAVQPNVGQRRTPQKRKQPKQRKNQVSVSQPVHIREGLLVIENGQVVDFRNDIKRSEKLDKSDRTRLRKEMREHFDIVRSFDDILEKFDATKMHIEQMKSR